MVRTSQHQFDVKVAQARADELKLDIVEWARRADVSAFTLRKFIYGDPSIKLRTVEDIVRPLGLTAMDLIKSNKKRA